MTITPLVKLFWGGEQLVISEKMAAINVISFVYSTASEMLLILLKLSSM